MSWSILFNNFQTDFAIWFCSAVCRFQVSTCKAVAFRQITSFKVMYQCFTNTNKIFQKKAIIDDFYESFCFSWHLENNNNSAKGFQKSRNLYIYGRNVVFLQTFLVVLPASAKTESRAETWLARTAELCWKWKSKTKTKIKNKKIKIYL